MLSSVLTNQNTENFRILREFIRLHQKTNPLRSIAVTTALLKMQFYCLKLGSALTRHSRALVPLQRLISNQWAANTASLSLIKTFSLGNVLS